MIVCLSLPRVCVCVLHAGPHILPPPGLRQDYASTTSVLANRRSQSFSFQLSQLSAGPDLEEEDEEDDEDYGLLPPPQLRLTRLPHSHTFSSVRDWRRSTSSLSTPPSTPSTPPYPSAGFAFQPQPQTQSQGLGLGSLCGAELQGFRPGSGEKRHVEHNVCSHSELVFYSTSSKKRRFKWYFWIILDYICNVRGLKNCHLKLQFNPMEGFSAFQLTNHKLVTDCRRNS